MDVHQTRHDEAPSPVDLRHLIRVVRDGIHRAQGNDPAATDQDRLVFEKRRTGHRDDVRSHDGERRLSCRRLRPSWRRQQQEDQRGD